MGFSKAKDSAARWQISVSLAEWTDGAPPRNVSEAVSSSTHYYMLVFPMQEFVCFGNRVSQNYIKPKVPVPSRSRPGPHAGTCQQTICDPMQLAVPAFYSFVGTVRTVLWSCVLCRTVSSLVPYRLVLDCITYCTYSNLHPATMWRRTLVPTRASARCDFASTRRG